MIRLLERVLNLRPGDFGRGSLLFLYLLLVIASYVIGKVARDALFLDKFKAVDLPWVVIGIAIFTGFVVSGYVAIGRRVSLRALLIGSLLFFSSNALLFWYLARFHQFLWLFPLFYVWVGIFGVLAPAQVWTLSNYVLTTREAKRIFGVVGGGAISGWIVGGFIAGRSKQFGAENLLLVMAAFHLICAALVVFIWK
ncbi:MAG: hypothetical protein ACRD2M_04285, partial [Terriglobales bacterium]